MEGKRGRKREDGRRGWETRKKKICPNTVTVNKIPNLNTVTLHKSGPVL